MKVNGIKYGRKFNLGNYEQEEISIDSSVEEKENPAETLFEMMKFVNTKGQSHASPSIQMELVPQKEEVEKENKKAAASPKKADSKIQKAEEKTEEKKEEQAPAKAEEKKEEQAPAKAEEKKEEEKPKIKVKQAATKYDRSNELHKKLFSELLDVKYPTWRKNPAKAASASRELVGKDFLDANGMKVKTFLDEVEKLMTV
jgi:hypothetical protein